MKNSAIPKDSSSHLTMLATEYARSRDLRVREEIARLAMENVTITARKMIRRVQGNILDLDELISAGNSLLCTVIEKYNPSEGKFENYLIGGLLLVMSQRIVSAAKRRTLSLNRTGGNGECYIEAEGYCTATKVTDCRELIEQLRQDIEEVPEPDREILRKRLFDGVTFIQLSKEMERSRERPRQIMKKYTKSPDYFRRTKKYLGLSLSVPAH